MPTLLFLPTAPPSSVHSNFRPRLSRHPPHTQHTITKPCISRRAIMSTTGDLHKLTVIPATGNNSQPIRPRNEMMFSIPYEDLVIRAWQPNDRDKCVELIGNVLAEYGLHWDPRTADRDVVDVESAYRSGEFWVVEDIKTSQVVGTAGFYEVPQRGNGAVEIRKMYLHRSVRARGLGSFLLSALEQRVHQLAYQRIYVETASVLKEACNLYKKKGYVPSYGLETKRCDIVLEKQVLPLLPPFEDHLEAVDMTRGWTVACVTREQATDHRLLFRAVVVLVESGGQIFVHKRSMKKSTLPGRLAVFVTGGVDWMENPLEAAKREVSEELGLTGLHFTEPFAPFIAKGSDGNGQRIRFHPFIARGDFTEEDVICNPNEVECGEFMSRAEIILRGIGGSLWKEYRERGL